MYAIPTRWLDGLEGRDVIEQVANDLADHLVETEHLRRDEGGPPTDMDRYPSN